MIELIRTFVNTIYSKKRRHFFDYELYLVFHDLDQFFMISIMRY